MRPPVVRYDPASGGWPTLEVPNYINLCLGNGTMFKVGLARLVSHTGEGLFVGVEGAGSYLMPSSSVSPGYVREKLGLRFDGDAAALADFINIQQGHRDVAPWATYDPRWTQDADG